MGEVPIRDRDYQFKVFNLFSKDIQMLKFYREAREQEYKNYDQKFINQNTLNFVNTFIEKC